MWIQEVLSRLEKVRQNKSRAMTWTALCPAHEDRHPSLSVWLGWKGFLLVRCWAGRRCQLPEILSAAGLSMGDLYPPDQQGPYGAYRGKRDAGPARREVAWYTYADEHGDLLYQTVRLEPKSFRQRRPNPDGGWVWNLDGVRRVLYRLPEVLAKPNWPVLVVEGERDVDALWKLGLVATCNVGGTGMGWRADYSVSLAGRRVVILPDNDEPGIRHACEVAGSLLLHQAQSVRILQLPNLPTSGDVSDYLIHSSPEDLFQQIRNTIEWRPTQ